MAKVIVPFNPTSLVPANSSAHYALADFDAILVNSSDGKDSQAMLGVVATAAAAQGVLDRVTVLYCDLGHVVWPGTRELAERQAAHYGVRLWSAGANSPRCRSRSRPAACGRLLGLDIAQVTRSEDQPASSLRNW